MNPDPNGSASLCRIPKIRIGVPELMDWAIFKRSRLLQISSEFGRQFLVRIDKKDFFGLRRGEETCSKQYCGAGAKGTKLKAKWSRN